MWPKSYAQRLTDWVRLRDHCSSIDVGQALLQINQWWYQCPWRPYYLHWDDRWNWPDPWQLLSDNIFCDVARALGMLYTVRMMDRMDCADAQMIETDRGNLVQVDQGKYIMNWNQEAIVNIRSQAIVIKRTLETSVLDHLTK